MLRQLTAICLSVGLAAPVLADTTLTYTDQANKSTMRYYIAAGQVRMEDSENDTTMLYQAATDTLTIINTEEREYSVLDPAARAELKKKMSAAMAEMKAKLADMPPEARQMMQGMMGGLMNSVKPSVQKTGQQQTVGGYDCSIVKIMIGGEVATELCIASADEVGVSTADYQAMQKMGASMQQMAEAVLQGLGADFSAMGELGGVAVSIRDDDGQALLTSVSDSAIPAATFQVPAGYTRKALDE